MDARARAGVVFDLYLEEHSGRAAEILWDAALVIARQAVDDTRATTQSRWRSFPRGELRVLRRDLARALALARLAVALQEDEHERSRDLTTVLNREAGLARARAGFEQRLPHSYVRHAHRQAKKLGVELGYWADEAELEHYGGDREAYAVAARERFEQRLAREPWRYGVSRQ